MVETETLLSLPLVIRTLPYNAGLIVTISPHLVTSPEPCLAVILQGLEQITSVATQTLYTTTLRHTVPVKEQRLRYHFNGQVLPLLYNL